VALNDLGGNEYRFKYERTSGVSRFSIGTLGGASPVGTTHEKTEFAAGRPLSNE
jgi:hypothetical protein